MNPSMPAPQQPPAFNKPIAPSTVTTAVYMMYAAAALNVVGFIVSIAMKDKLREAVEDANSNLSSSEVDTAVTVALVFTGIFTVVGIALWLTMAYFIKQGRNWARITGTVFFGIATVATICAMATQDNPAATNIISGLSWVIALVVTILLWLPASSAFFAAVANPFVPQQPQQQPPSYPPAA